jgi:hypothetical protein
MGGALVASGVISGRGRQAEGLEEAFLWVVAPPIGMGIGSVAGIIIGAGARTDQWVEVHLTPIRPSMKVLLDGSPGFGFSVLVRR